MASNIREFSAALAKDAAEWPDAEISKLHRAAHFEVARRTILASPVDEGRFRANWQTGVEQAPTGEVDAADTNGAGTLALTAAEIAGVKGPTVSYLVNNLPYAESLAEGHSPQAPPGWLDAILEGVSVWIEGR